MTPNVQNITVSFKDIDVDPLLRKFADPCPLYAFHDIATSATLTALVDVELIGIHMLATDGLRAFLPRSKTTLKRVRFMVVQL
ncbi:hypothetical protein E6O75_ATG05787 [Venturia nashicola]|uniref:Uncharacterized protein n=1 Tax=Venturia nashicola TaxID=86259 RepID=A0A4Z1PGD3_9PEZI|nr:hypothetical protein E6O75_ATG05787 [Venturia nashicola]